MRLIRDALTKLLRNLNIPYEDLRDMGDYVEVSLGQPLSYDSLYTVISGDIRYDKSVEHLEKGFFVHLRNLSYPGVGVRADVAVKFFVKDSKVIRITAVICKATVFMSSGDRCTAFSRSEVLRLLEISASDQRVDKETKSVG